MALPTKLALPDIYIEEMQKMVEIMNNPLRTTVGQATFQNPRTLASYTTAGSAYDNQGESGLGLLLYNTSPTLRDYIFDANTYNSMNSEFQNVLDEVTTLMASAQQAITATTSLSGFSNGVELDGTTGKLQLWKNPQGKFGTRTVNESKTVVYNTSYDVLMTGSPSVYFSKYMMVKIKSNTSAHSMMAFIAKTSTGAYETVYFGSDGSFLFKSYNGADGDLVYVNSSSVLGAGLLTGNTSHQYVFRLQWRQDDNLPKVIFNVASLGTPNYTLNFDIDVYAM